jgi:hypothetical protein
MSAEVHAGVFSNMGTEAEKEVHRRLRQAFSTLVSTGDDALTACTKMLTASALLPLPSPAQVEAEDVPTMMSAISELMTSVTVSLYASVIAQTPHAWPSTAKRQAFIADLLRQHSAAVMAVLKDEAAQHAMRELAQTAGVDTATH